MVALNKKKRVERLVTRPLLVRIMRASGLRSVDRGNSDPFVYVFVSKTESSPVMALSKSR